MIFSAPTGTVLRPIRNTQEKDKFKLHSFLTVCPSTPRKQQGGGGLKENHNCRKFPEWRIVKMLSFWISFCELYFLLCSLTSQLFAIATELPVNHTLSFVENLKNLKFLHARQNWTFTIKIIFIFSWRKWKNYAMLRDYWHILYTHYRAKFLFFGSQTYRYCPARSD